MSNYHVSVLLQEAINALQIQKGQKYIDATLGGGGHTKAILDMGGIVLGIDQDDDALSYAQKSLASEVATKQLTITKGNFSSINRIAKDRGFDSVAGILFDIGVSAHQLEAGERGFSFLSDAPLDMRMNRDLQVTAADLVNGLHKNELVDLLTKFGEEPFAKKIAEVVVKSRLEKPIQTTKELADLVARAIPKIGKAHPATRIFQALRIAVNDELNSLEEGLRGGLELLQSGGRMVVISFHSLEDRIVKNTFAEFAKENLGKEVTDKPVVPGEKEVMSNPRSRSAKMRVFVKA